MSSWNESQTITNLQDRILDQEVTIAELRRELDSLTTQKNFAEVEVDRLERAAKGNTGAEVAASLGFIHDTLTELTALLQRGITVYVEEG